MSEFDPIGKCADIGPYRFIWRGVRIEVNTFSCPITSLLPQVCSRAAQSRRSRILISRRPFTEALRAIGHAVRRAAEGDDGRHDPVGSISGSVLPNFDQRLPTAQGAFYGGKLGCQPSMKRGIGGVAHSQSHHLQSVAPSRSFGKICVLRPDDRPHLPSLGLDCVVRGRAEPEIVDVNGTMTSLRQPTGEARWQLCINEKMHSQAARMTRCEVAAAPYARAAFRSASLR